MDASTFIFHRDVDVDDEEGGVTEIVQMIGH